LIEALLLGTVSSFSGAVLGTSSCLAVAVLEFGIPVIREAPVGGLILGASLTTLLGVFLSVIAAIYPSLIAARMQPVEAMRKEV
jgi:ABC-type antimicrobial peptide transport system permease subunit